jgi:hypothetical protein
VFDAVFLLLPRAEAPASVFFLPRLLLFGSSPFGLC